MPMSSHRGGLQKKRVCNSSPGKAAAPNRVPLSKERAAGGLLVEYWGMVRLLSLLRHAGRAPELIEASRQTPALSKLLRHYLELGQPQYPLHLPLRGGGLLTLSDPTEVKVFWNLFVHGAYTIPEACETILDCGANAGIFCVWAVRQRPSVRIIALEPFPLTFAGLEANIRQNHLESQVQCVQVGLAASAGDRSMSSAADSPDRRVVPDGSRAPQETVPVRCIRLIDCLQELRMEKVIC
jgi:FkbM family methyltransferase